MCCTDVVQRIHPSNLSPSLLILALAHTTHTSVILNGTSGTSLFVGDCHCQLFACWLSISSAPVIASEKVKRDPKNQPLLHSPTSYLEHWMHSAFSPRPFLQSGSAATCVGVDSVWQPGIRASLVVIHDYHIVDYLPAHGWQSEEYVLFETKDPRISKAFFVGFALTALVAATRWRLSAVQHAKCPWRHISFPSIAMADHDRDVKDARVELQLQWADLRKELVELLARKDPGWGQGGARVRW